MPSVCYVAIALPERIFYLISLFSFFPTHSHTTSIPTSISTEQVLCVGLYFLRCDWLGKRPLIVPEPVLCSDVSEENMEKEGL